MDNKNYINYLNSLNSYNSKNKNAYSEKNIENEFFNETSVEMGVSEYIKNKLDTETPHIIILTGQAGDGKTSILYQVVKKINPSYNIETNVNTFNMTLENGKSCFFLKDFSEIPDNNRVEKLREAFNLPSEGNSFAFIVANTGPLINTFGELFSDGEKDKTKMNLIKAIKESNGKCNDICNYNISIVNMTSLDNSSFAVKYIEKLVQDKLWTNCNNCNKKDFCPILRNKNLLSNNLTPVKKFLEYHYIWLAENGIRLTVRSITEQLSFMITGGKSCRSIDSNSNYNLLFPNLFFGLSGFENDNKALKMIAIEAANKRAYFKNKMNIDDQLIMERKYSDIFTSDWCRIISDIEKSVEMSPINLLEQRSKFYLFLRRVYLFQNILSEDKKEAELANIFSKYFSMFIKCRKSTSPVPIAIKKLILDGLSMIYTGTKSRDRVPVTLNNKSGILQSVQFVTGKLYADDLIIKKIKTNNGPLNQSEDIYYLYVELNGQCINVRLTLPLLDYFDNLQKGIIETDIDPLLSHGIETLKVRVSQLVRKNEDYFELILLKNDGSQKNIMLQFDNDKLLKI